MYYNNRHDYMSLKDMCSVTIGWITVIVILSSVTFASIYKHEEECKVFKAQLVKDYSTWQIDLAKLPFGGYKQKLVSAVSYNEALIKYQQQCLGAYAN